MVMTCPCCPLPRLSHQRVVFFSGQHSRVHIHIHRRSRSRQHLPSDKNHMSQLALPLVPGSTFRASSRSPIAGDDAADFKTSTSTSANSLSGSTSSLNTTKHEEEESSTRYENGEVAESCGLALAILACAVVAGVATTGVLTTTMACAHVLLTTAIYLVRRRTFNGMTISRMLELHFTPQPAFTPVFLAWLLFNSTLYVLAEPFVFLFTRGQGTLAYFYYPLAAGAGVVFEVRRKRILRLDWHRFKLGATASSNGHTIRYANMPHVDWDLRSLADESWAGASWARRSHFPWRQLFHYVSYDYARQKRIRAAAPKTIDGEYLTRAQRRHKRQEGSKHEARRETTDV
ncbi:hypothetical protein NFJ02_07g133070 [Pycnococcus provasolii]